LATPAQKAAFLSHLYYLTVFARFVFDADFGCTISPTGKNQMLFRDIRFSVAVTQSSLLTV